MDINYFLIKIGERLCDEIIHNINRTPVLIFFVVKMLCQRQFNAEILWIRSSTFPPSLLFMRVVNFISLKFHMKHANRLFFQERGMEPGLRETKDYYCVCFCNSTIIGIILFQSVRKIYLSNGCKLLTRNKMHTSHILF